MSLIEIGPAFAPVRAGGVVARREAVTFCCGERGGVRRMARRLFGRTVAPDELAGLTGAPDGSEVEVGVYHAGLHLEYGDPPAHRWHGVCQVFPCLGGLTMRIESLRIDPPWTRGQGLGRLMFARQTRAAVALGIRCIRLVAGRGPDENGYYTHPTLK